MKEELRGPKMEGVSITAVHEKGEDDTMVYNVYLINEREDILEQVMVTSKGYGTVEKTEEKIETSTLRKLIGIVDPKSFVKIEPIIEEVFGLNNEYLVSFWIDDVLYDKKFIFLPETIKQENFVITPLIEKPGVMIG